MTFGAAQGDRESGVIGEGERPFSADRSEGQSPGRNSAASITPPPFAPHGGSQQLRLFRRAIRDGASLSEACAASGGSIGEVEGRIYLAADAKSPPPPEAYELLYPAPAKETDMARAKKQQEDFDDSNGVTGEYKRPDAAKAFDIYDKQIKPKLAVIDTKRGECSQPWSDIKEHANFPRPVMNFIIMLDNIDDDQKRDHFLLALRDGLRTRKHFLPTDLATLADGDAGDDAIPTGERPRPFLAAVGTTNLHEAIGFTEADEAELAQQKDRPSVQAAQAEAEAAAEDAGTEPAPGTGAAAIAAMKRQAEEAETKN